jgi:hypothetical protein
MLAWVGDFMPTVTILFAFIIIGLVMLISAWYRNENVGRRKLK